LGRRYFRQAIQVGFVAAALSHVPPELLPMRILERLYGKIS